MSHGDKQNGKKAQNGDMDAAVLFFLHLKKFNA